ncbi:MAG: extracellular solute-binding protein [Clostridia bacterium]|nr:extracellular solute-binding protein [Clostridia bacterium]MBQ9857265.1 extracellular solute-binding protein [Clostridia bacterium]
MKRVLCLLLAVITIALSGCAGGKKEENGIKTVTIWHDKEEAVIEVLQNALKGFENEIKVVFEKKTGLTESLKLVGNDANAAPDMYFFAHDKIGVYAEMGILTPITDVLGEKALDGYVNLAASGAMYKGKAYQMPLYFETLLFMYNKKYMKQEDIPKTTEQLYEYMVRKTKYGHYGFVEQHSTPYYAAGWIHGFGGSLISTDGKPMLDTENVKKAVQYHKKFVEFMPGETEYAMVNTLFTSGMAHATIAGPWFIPTVRASGIDVGIAPMPVVDETGLALAPYSGIQGVHVIKARFNKNADAIKTVLKALQKPEIMIALSKASGCAPAMEVCYEDPSVRSDELIMAMRETAENAYPMPNIPEMDVMWTVAGNLLTDVNMSGKDIETAAKDAQKKAEQLIEAMR